MRSVFIVITCYILTATSLFSQSRWDPSDYTLFTYKNFRTFAPFSDTLNSDSVNIPQLDAVIFFMTNEIRAQKKLGILSYSAQLEATALMHSKDMVEKDFFSHFNKYDKKKSDPNARARLMGIKNPFLSENIAETFCLRYKPNKEVYTSGPGRFSYKPEGELIQPHTYLSLGETLLQMWMSSPEHRKNILSPSALQLGCGVYLYKDKKFNDMPTIMATQNYQWYEPIKTSGIFNK